MTGTFLIYVQTVLFDARNIFKRHESATHYSYIRFSSQQVLNNWPDRLDRFVSFGFAFSGALHFWVLRWGFSGILYVMLLFAGTSSAELEIQRQARVRSSVLLAWAGKETVSQKSTITVVFVSGTSFYRCSEHSWDPDYHSNSPDGAKASIT